MKLLMIGLAIVVAATAALAAVVAPLAVAMPAMAAHLDGGTLLPTLTSPTGPAGTSGPGARDIPVHILDLYVSAARRCPGLPWSVLAGIGKVESDHGRGPQLSPAGAEGPMQFMPATWAHYGVDGDGDGVASIWDAADAVPAAADYLCANGGGQPTGLSAAILQYNHDASYVRLVLAWANAYSGAAPTTLTS